MYQYHGTENAFRQKQNYTTQQFSIHTGIYIRNMSIPILFKYNYSNEFSIIPVKFCAICA